MRIKVHIKYQRIFICKIYGYFTDFILILMIIVVWVCNMINDYNYGERT